MIKFLQASLGRGREAQDLLLQQARIKHNDVLIVSDYKMPDQWFQNATARAAIVVENKTLNIGEVNAKSVNFVWVEIGDIRVYRVYLLSNDTYEDVQRELEELEESFRTASREVLVAGNLNCKSPELGSKKLDARGKALSEMVAKLDMLILNKRSVPTLRQGNKTDVTIGTVVEAAKISG